MYIDYIEGMTSTEYINLIINTRGQWNIPDGVYWEGHHILPKCLGGVGSTKAKHKNIIRLYAREHFIVHRLLALENKDNDKLVNAYVMMAFPSSPTQNNNRYELTPEEYEEARLLWSQYMSAHNPWLKNGKPWNYGLTKETDERVARYSQSLKGVNTWTKGVQKTPETRNKMSIATHARYLEKPETFVGGTKNKKAINNGTTCVYIDKDAEIPEGWIEGQGKRKNGYHIKNTELNSQIRSALTKGENNPMFGKGYLISGGNNGKATKYYIFDNIRFECRKDLINYLNNAGYNVSNSTLRSIEDNTYGCRIGQKYADIIHKLIWGYKRED